MVEIIIHAAAYVVIGIAIVWAVFDKIKRGGR